MLVGGEADGKGIVCTSCEIFINSVAYFGQLLE